MDGLLPLWKERGMTSHDCVFQLRKILHTKKIGHGGTLDPEVDGVLPIAIGKGTKMLEFISDHTKIYEGEITLGLSTTTEDAYGEVVEEKKVTDPFSSDEIDRVMTLLSGTITQIPPMYSAVKVNGRKLYEYARAGQEVQRPKRQVTICSFERCDQPIWDPQKGIQSWHFRVVCGKGTYVRTLAVDTGKLLGIPAYMSDLTRIASGGFTKEQAVTLSEVAKLVENKQFLEVLLPIESTVKDMLHLDLTNELWQKIKNGRPLPFHEFELEKCPQELVALFYENQLVSIYEPSEKQKGWLKPRKVLQTN